MGIQLSSHVSLSVSHGQQNRKVPIVWRCTKEGRLQVNQSGGSGPYRLTPARCPINE